MRKVLLTAAVLGLAACGPKQGETGAADTSAAATPTMGSDSMSGMSHDSMSTSTTDTAMARDTAAK